MTRLAFSALAAISLVAGSASAAVSLPADTALPAAVRVDGPSPERFTADRSDWSLRLSGGFSLFGEVVATDNKNGSREREAHTGGASVVSEFSISRYVTPALAIGLSVLDVRAFATNRSANNAEDLGLAGGRGRLSMFGPKLDWHFSQLNPGLRLQTSLGFALAGGTAGNGNTVGGGFSFGFGYDLPMSDRLALGVSLLATGAITTDRSGGTRFFHVVGSGPALGLSLSFR